MVEPKLDEIDGECPVLSNVSKKKLGLLKEPELEKSLTDSGMDDGSNSGSLETVSGENSDDEDVVLRKPKPKKPMQRILDDDSDYSQEVPDLREKRKQEFTPEEALDEVMRESSDESQDDDTPTKKKRIKRPVSDDSSADEDENVSLMETIKKNAADGDSNLLSTGEESKEEGESRLDSQENNDVKRKIPDDLFDDEKSDSDSSGCKSSGSEAEKSDNEQGDDEGFDESSVDPKLLAKLKKGAAKKPKKKTKREEMQDIHSESQRLVRESRVNLPYHQPAPKSINDFLERASRKQHEYKVLRGFRESTKAKLIQDILQKTKLQSKPKTQEELDKYSDSDEDWNPEEEKEKTLKDRIDERIRNKSGGGMPLSEIPLGDIADVEDSNESSIKIARDVDGNDSDDLPDIEDSLDVLEKVNKHDKAQNDDDVGNMTAQDKQNIDMVENGDKCDEEKIEESEKLSELCESVHKNDVGETSALNQDGADDLLYDWEKTDQTDENQRKDIENGEGCSMDCAKDTEKSDENKENIDPNKSQSENTEEVQVPVLTPSRRERTSPSSSAKKKKKTKIAALAGIDLDAIKPCLSGNMDMFVSLEEEEKVPVNPGVQKLMDRLQKHSAKVERKSKKETDISIISKDIVGVDKEELKLDSFTYQSNEEETNPLLKLDAPGAKLVALKEQLKEKMKARREVARQKRQEVYDLDNEEGGYEAEEEEEMSEHSDTDVEEEEDFEEEYGDGEDEEEIEEEEEKERNPFADEEAEEEDDGGDDYEELDNADKEEADDSEDDDINLKLDWTDEEESDNEVGENDDQSKDKKNKCKEKHAEFKEPKEPTVPEKPFSIFGQKGNSINETQFQSGQTKTSSLPLPIEDSQDLYGSILPGISHTQNVKPTQSDDFSFFMEDSQSNMLDADGYLKTKSTGKKKAPISAFKVDEGSTQNNMDELLGLCSGRFMESQTEGKEKTSRKSLFDESSASNTQSNMDELMGLCSGVFTDKATTQTEKKGKKRSASEVESDDDSIAAYSDNEEKPSEKDESEEENNDSDADGDTDHIESDAEDEEEEDKNRKFKGFTVKNKHGKIRKEFVEAEAELSGSEYDSDENLDLAEEDDIMEIEEGDKDAAKLNEDELRDEVGRVHLKQLIDEDKRELLRFQEMYLPDGDLHSEGGGRMRRFRWSNMNGEESQQDMFNDGSDVEENNEEAEDFQWRKERYEREQFLKEQQEKDNDAENSQFLKLGKVFLKKKGSLDTTSSSESTSKSKDSGAETPGFPGSIYKLSQQKRGSFLARSKEALAKIAEMTKPVVNPSAGAKSSGKFTFNVISPDKDREQEATVKSKQRKAHVPKVSEAKSKQPPAKRPKLDSQSSFTENSIFHHI